MGYTGTSVHLLLGTTKVADSNSPRLVERLQAALEKLGYERIAPGVADGAWWLTGTPPWLTLVDATASPVVTRECAELVRSLSLALGVPAIVTAVNDSDDFSFLIFHRGEQVDGYATSADQVAFPFTECSLRQRTQLTKRLFGVALGPDDWQSILARSEPFAELALNELGQRLGIPRTQLGWTGTDSASAGDSPQWLAFARRSVPAGPAGPGRDPAVIQVLAGNSDHASGESGARKRIPLIPGELAYVAFTLSGTSEAFSEPAFECSGDAVERGYVTVQITPAMWQCGKMHVALPRVPGVEVQHQSAAVDGAAVNRSLWRGVSSAALQLAPHAPSTLTGVVTLRGVMPGAGVARVTCQPKKTDPYRLPLEPVLEVETIEPAWIPLGAALGESSQQEGVRRLNDPRILSGVAITLDVDGELLALLGEHVGRWLISACRATGASEIQFATEAQMEGDSLRVRKKKGILAAAELPAKKWQKLWDSQPKQQSMFLDVVSGSARRALAGAAVQRSAPSEPALSEPGQRELGQRGLDARSGTLHVALWSDLATPARPAVDGGVRQSFEDLVASWGVRAGLLQAWIAAWDWIPRFSTADENLYSPYEQACGCDSPAAEFALAEGSYMQFGWCRQRVRGIGGTMWLSEYLVQQLEINALTELTLVQRLATGIARLDLKPDASLQRLELLLRPILPGPVS